MQSPDEDAGQGRPAGFQGDQVADAGFVLTAGVVYDQDLSGFGTVNGLEKDVDAAKVSGRTGAADQVRAAPTVARFPAGRSGQLCPGACTRLRRAGW
ncbi:hypothetical protein ABH915_002098 [Arthrobacter sp. MW3 TE3886]